MYGRRRRWLLQGEFTQEGENYWLEEIRMQSIPSRNERPNELEVVIRWQLQDKSRNFVCLLMGESDEKEKYTKIDPGIELIGIQRSPHVLW